MKQGEKNSVCQHAMTPGWSGTLALAPSRLDIYLTAIYLTEVCPVVSALRLGPGSAFSPSSPCPDTILARIFAPPSATSRVKLGTNLPQPQEIRVCRFACSRTEKQSGKPDRHVYSITQKGRNQLIQ